MCKSYPPLGALDRALRERLLEELPEILRRAGVAAVTVTHDQRRSVCAGQPQGGVNPVDGVVKERTFRGGHHRIVVACRQGTTLTLEWPSGPSVPRTGEVVRCHLDPSGIVLLLSGGR